MTTGLRLATVADAAALAAIYAPFCEGSHVSFELTAPTPEEMAGRVAAVTRTHPWLVLEAGGEVAGYAYASSHRDRAAYRWSVDVAVYVAPGHRGAGVGRALYVALARVLALQGYHRAYAGIALPNPGSIGLHEAVGFRPVGVYRGVGHKLGAWRDVAWYQLDLRDDRAEPAPPLAPAEVAGTPAWRAALAAGLAELAAPGRRAAGRER
jgi:phosphinothricin acetyltransferase